MIPKNYPTAPAPQPNPPRPDTSDFLEDEVLEAESADMAPDGLRHFVAERVRVAVDRAENANEVRLAKALGVVLLDRKLSRLVANADPQAFKQALHAVGALS